MEARTQERVTPGAGKDHLKAWLVREGRAWFLALVQSHDLCPHSLVSGDETVTPL